MYGFSEVVCGQCSEPEEWLARGQFKHQVYEGGRESEGPAGLDPLQVSLIWQKDHGRRVMYRMVEKFE